MSTRSNGEMTIEEIYKLLESGKHCFTIELENDYVSVWCDETLAFTVPANNHIKDQLLYLGAAILNMNETITIEMLPPVSWVESAKITVDFTRTKPSPQAQGLVLMDVNILEDLEQALQPIAEEVAKTQSGNTDENHDEDDKSNSESDNETYPDTVDIVHDYDPSYNDDHEEPDPVDGIAEITIQLNNHYNYQNTIDDTVNISDNIEMRILLMLFLDPLYRLFTNNPVSWYPFQLMCDLALDGALWQIPQESLRWTIDQNRLFMEKYYESQ